MSRIERRIFSELSNEVSEKKRAELKARLAIYYYQKGEIEKANHEVFEVRQWLSASSDSTVMVYINLAESTCLYQLGAPAEAALKARRAYAVSCASARPDLIAFSASWLAHLEFNSDNHESTICLLGESLVRADGAESVAQARCFSLVADIFNFCGDFPAAGPWYRKARSAAVEDGDEIMLGQIIYNSAIYRFNNIRLSSVAGEIFPEESRFTELMIDSTSNYDLGVKSTAFKSLLPMLNAQLLTFRGKYAEACEIFENWLGPTESRVDYRMSCLCLADYAFSLAKLGQTQAALEQLTRFSESEHHALPTDDASLVSFQMSGLYNITGNQSLAEAYYRRARVELRKTLDIQAQTLALLKATLTDKLGV